MADAQSSGMLATLVPVVIGGVIALSGTWLGPWISERHKEKQERKKINASKFEELVAAVYEFDGWLDKERDANFANEASKQGMSPFAKLEAIEPYAEARNKLLQALRDFAHKEFR